MKPWHYWAIGGGVLTLLVVGLPKTSGGSDGSVSSSGGTVTIREMSEAIARAEGFYAPGSRASRENNPGNIFSKGGTVYNSYPTLEEGWRALDNVVRNYWTGKWYSNARTWRDLAWMYVNGTVPGAAISRPGSGDAPDNWLAIVTGALGLDVDPMEEWRPYVSA